MMSLSNFKQSLTTTAIAIGAIGTGLLVRTAPVSAFSIIFEDNFSDFSNWNTYGDTLIQDTLNGTYGGDSRSYNAGTGNQATLSTACPNSVGTECYSVSDPSSARDDDPNAPIGTYNFSGSDQYDANAETTDGSSLQSALGLDFNALNIQAQEGDTEIVGGTRLPKEGSGMTLDGGISASNQFQISFNWNFLTNDAQEATFGLGDSDYAFVVIYEEGSSTETRIPIVLSDSDATSYPTIASDDTAYALSTSGTYISDTLEPGNYSVGFGVVDVWGVNRSSALLVDDFLVEEVPFEFSPTLGLFLSGGILTLINRYKKRTQSQSKC